MIRLKEIIPFVSRGAAALGLSLLVACAGDPPKATPIHLRAGTEQIKSGNAFYQKGCYKRALEHYSRAHELYTAADQPEGVAMSLNNIGSAYRAQGESRLSLSYFSDAAGYYRRVEDGAGLRQVLSNRAAALIDLGDLTGAGGVLEEAGRIQDKGAVRPFLPLLINKGILLTRMGRYGEAQEALEGALARTDPDSPAEQAVVHFALGNLLSETKRYAQAVRHFEAALKADRTSGFYKGIADDLTALGRASRALERHSEAVDYFERSIKIYSLLGLKRERDETSGLLKSACSEAGEKCSSELTGFFVDRWSEGKRMGNPCED